MSITTAGTSPTTGIRRIDTVHSTAARFRLAGHVVATFSPGPGGALELLAV